MSHVKMKLLHINLLILHIPKFLLVRLPFCTRPTVRQRRIIHLTKFCLVRTSGRVDSLDSVVRHSHNVNNVNKGNAV